LALSNFDGSMQPTRTIAIPIFAHDLLLTDGDDDGHAELIALGVGAAVADRIEEEDATFSSPQLVDFTFGSAVNVAPRADTHFAHATDLDGDGIIELIAIGARAGQEAAALQVLQSNGTTLAWSAGARALVRESTSTFRLADVDGDGDADVFVEGFAMPFENVDGELLAHPMRAIELDGEPTDLNNDGYIDFVGHATVMSGCTAPP
jgi:hypothetical protein